MTISYEAGRRIQGLSSYDVTWNSGSTTGFSISGNTVTSTTSGWTNTYARSTQSFTVGSGEVEITGTVDLGSSHDGRIGFNTGTVSGSNYNDFEWYADGGYSYIFENNVQKFEVGGGAARNQGDIYTVKIDNAGEVTYYFNGVYQYTSLTTASGTYYIDVKANVSGSIITGTIVDVKPTNVQTGSRFEETDTRKMYHKVDTVTGADVSLTGLKAYWRFNGSTVSNVSTSSDSLGTSADLALTGTTVTTSGGTSPFGYEGVWDGTDDFGKAGTSLSQFNFLHNQSALWTVAFWHKSNGNDSFIVNSADNLKVSDNVGFNINQGSNNSLGIILGTGLGASGETNHSTSINYVPDTTTWHFYCLTFDESLASSNLNVRRDNANLETFNKEHTNSNSNATYALHVGGMSGFTGDLNGGISEMSIWNRVLTTAEQTSLYNSGSGKVIDTNTWKEEGT